ncbi:MAG TPA: ATP-binding protein [Streptosporangiaceae bacterium]|nr:ATP-binding protein [Streptosporangiaceae bacterium]
MTGTATAPAAPPIPDELDAVLRRMRFPYLRKAAPGVLATARSQRWDPAEVIRILLEEEIRGRDEAGRRIRRKAAGLPAGKTFASWREDASSIPLPAQHALMTLEWITRAENLCIAGPSGTGKSHFAEALAHKAIDNGMRVAWFTLESLTAVLGRAAVDGTTARAIAKITRCDLVAIDLCRPRDYAERTACFAVPGLDGPVSRRHSPVSCRTRRRPGQLAWHAGS